MLDLADSTWWWVAAGALVAVELLTGTFYLLMLALGLVAAALAAQSGLVFAYQMVAAALVGGGTVAAWHIYRIRQAAAHPDKVVSLDVGEKVHVLQWADDGTTRVQYRGAAWAAVYEGSDAPQAGLHVIKAIQGTRLVLGR